MRKILMSLAVIVVIFVNSVTAFASEQVVALNDLNPKGFESFIYLESSYGSGIYAFWLYDDIRENGHYLLLSECSLVKYDKSMGTFSTPIHYNDISIDAIKNYDFGYRDSVKMYTNDTRVPILYDGLVDQSYSNNDYISTEKNTIVDKFKSLTGLSLPSLSHLARGKVEVAQIMGTVMKMVPTIVAFSLLCWSFWKGYSMLLKIFRTL